MKYIVYWMIIRFSMIGCPLPTPTKDEFGRITPNGNYYIDDGRLCFSQDTSKMKKEFSIRKDAIDFFNRGVKAQSQEPFNLNADAITNFKLDSIKLYNQ